MAAGLEALRLCLDEYRGRVTVTSSFGADSTVLLSLVADIDPATPVLFIDTGRHFPETLGHRHALAARLGLRDVRDIRPEAATLDARDPGGTLHALDPDACCALRKVEPLDRALAPFAAWITGRRRSQAATRATMPIVEREDGVTKVNPLAHWSAARIEAELDRRGLPRHPLVGHGFTSIGCAPCTRAAEPGADPRSGRWTMAGKTECGIHRRPGHHASQQPTNPGHAS